MAISITGLRVLCDVDDEAEETVDHQNVICGTEGEAADTDESREYRHLPLDSAQLVSRYRTEPITSRIQERSLT